MCKKALAITRGIKHWGLSGYSNILSRIKFSVSGQESNPYSPTISHCQALCGILTHQQFDKIQHYKAQYSGSDLLTGIVVAIVAAAAIGWAIYQSKKESGDLVAEETK